MPVGCGSASVTSSSIRASDAAVPTAAVVDCLSTNHWVRPQLGLVPEKRHQLPGKPLLIFEQWDQQVRQRRSRSAPQLLTPSLPPSLPETPSLPLCSLTQLLPCKKKEKKAFLQMRRRRGGLIRDRLSRARECAEAKKTTNKKKHGEKRTVRTETVGLRWQMRSLQEPLWDLSGFCRSPQGSSGTLRPGDVRAPPFGTIAHVWSSSAAGRPVQSITHLSASYSSPRWQKWLIFSSNYSVRCDQRGTGTTLTQEDKLKGSKLLIIDKLNLKKHSKSASFHICQYWSCTHTRNNCLQAKKWCGCKNDAFGSMGVKKLIYYPRGSLLGFARLTFEGDECVQVIIRIRYSMSTLGSRLEMYPQWWIQRY